MDTGILEGIFDQTVRGQSENQRTVARLRPLRDSLMKGRGSPGAWKVFPEIFLQIRLAQLTHDFQDEILIGFRRFGSQPAQQGSEIRQGGVPCRQARSGADEQNRPTFDHSMVIEEPNEVFNLRGCDGHSAAPGVR
ncbi:MAG: hypothetical protein ABUT39_21980 [Acidobacteriota bacterium]